MKSDRHRKQTVILFSWSNRGNFVIFHLFPISDIFTHAFLIHDLKNAYIVKTGG